MAFEHEEKHPLRDAVKRSRIPGLTYPIAWRWSATGAQCRNGRRVRLERLRVGNKLFTSVEAIHRCIAAVNAADAEHFTRDDSGATAGERRDTSTEHDQAAAECARLGV